MLARHESETKINHNPDVIKVEVNHRGVELRKEAIDLLKEKMMMKEEINIEFVRDYID